MLHWLRTWGVCKAIPLQNEMINMRPEQNRTKSMSKPEANGSPSQGVSILCLHTWPSESLTAPWEAHYKHLTGENKAPAWAVRMSARYGTSPASEWLLPYSPTQPRPVKAVSCTSRQRAGLSGGYIWTLMLCGRRHHDIHPKWLTQ